MTRLSSTIATVIALGALPLSAQSLDSVLSHRILPGWVQSDGTRVAGLELRLAEGWKTYWRSPGEAGIPPEFNWSGTSNIADVSVSWPTPHVFWQSGMRSVGYADRVVLPLRITPGQSRDDMHLRGEVNLGICSDICVPATIEIDAALPAARSKRDPELVAALAAVPYSAREAGVRDVSCRFWPVEGGLGLEARIHVPVMGGREAAVVEETGGLLWISEPELAREGDNLTVSAEMFALSDGPIALDRSAVRITVIGEGQAVDIQGCPG